MNRVYRVGLEISKLFLIPLLKASERSFKRAERARDVTKRTGEEYLISEAVGRYFRRMYLMHTFQGKLNRIELKIQNAS